MIEFREEATMDIKRMSKEDFMINLLEIKEDLDFYNNLYSLSREYKREDEINIMPKSIATAIKCLEAAIGDKYEYVSWFIWEKDWGERGKDFAVYDEEGNVIPTETLEDIYDLVTKNIIYDKEKD